MNYIKESNKLIFVIIILLGSLTPFQVQAAGNFAAGSSIGGVVVENLTATEAKMKLQEEAAEWLSEEELIAEGEYGEFAIPRSLFSFDVDYSLQELEEKTKRHWSRFFMKKKNVHIPIAVMVKEEYHDILPNYVDKEKLIADAITVASNFEEGPIRVEYVKQPLEDQEEIASVSFSFPDISVAVTKYIAEELNGFTIEPTSMFSFLEHVTLLEGMANSEAEMSFIASAMYRLFLQTNIEVIERHSQRVIPSYTEAGLEVAVNREEEKDFLVYNPNDFSYTIHTKLNENELQMSLHSLKPKQVYEYKIVNRKEIEPKSIYRYSPDLNPGEEQLIQAGKSGIQVEVSRGVKGTGEMDLISRDYYPTTPEIILVSSKEQEESTGIPTELEQIDVSNIDSLLTEQGLNSENMSEEDYSQLLLACMLKGGEETDETAGESEFDFCHLLWLSFFFSMLNGEEEAPTEIDGRETEQVTEELEEALETEGVE